MYVFRNFLYDLCFVCVGLMSRVQATRDHHGKDCRFLSFRRGETIFVYHKLAGKRGDLWAGTVSLTAPSLSPKSNNARFYIEEISPDSNTENSGSFILIGLFMVTLYLMNTNVCESVPVHIYDGVTMYENRQNKWCIVNTNILMCWPNITTYLRVFYLAYHFSHPLYKTYSAFQRHFIIDYDGNEWILDEIRFYKFKNNRNEIPFLQAMLFISMYPLEFLKVLGQSVCVI